MVATRLYTSSSKHEFGRFLIKAALFLCVLGAIQLLLFLVLPRNPYSYHHCISKKLQSLERCSESKIVLVGGSNLAFGCDSRKMQESLEMPVFNSSHHAALGLSFILNSVDRSLVSNDIVILSLEYEHFGIVPWTGDNTLSEALFEDPSLFKLITWRHIPDVAGYLPVVLRDRLLYALDTSSLDFASGPIYNDKSCNAHGDVITHLKIKRPQTKIPVRRQKAKIPRKCESVRRLAEVVERWQKRGVNVVLVPPAIRECDFRANKKFMNECITTLRAELSCPVPLNAADELYPDELFVDTHYHLTKKSRSQRTERLINVISELQIVLARRGTDGHERGGPSAKR